MRSTTRSLLWLASAIAITPFTWSIVASVELALVAPAAERSVLGFLAGAFFGAGWGAVVVVPLALPYSLPLLAWPSFVRHFPRIESSRTGLIAAAGVMALPAALYVGVESGRFADTIRPREFWLAFGSALSAGCLGLWVPRILFKHLAPGQFLTSPTRTAV